MPRICIRERDSAKIRAKLADPERRTNRSARRYLLTRLLKCGNCGEYLVSRPRSDGQRRYVCASGPGFSGCGHLYITADEVEAWVLDACFYRLDSPQLAATLDNRNPATSDLAGSGDMLPRWPNRGCGWTAWRRRGSLLLMRQAIKTPNAPTSPLFSQAVKAGGHIYLSGLVGVDVSTGRLAGQTIKEQTRQALMNCQAVLRAAGATLEDVVEVGVLLTNPDDFAGMNDEYATWFQDAPPTRYVAKLGVDVPGVLVSIRMTAFVG
jgi:2-iminobutanoate/2-iminopropanoate deaminase